jgi:hypothetical protein
MGFDSYHINFYMILSSYFTIQGMFFLFDYLYRIMNTIKIIIRFWRRGGLVLPKIDLSSSHGIDITNICGEMNCFNRLYYFMRILPYIWIQVVIMVGIAVAIISVIVSKSFFDYVQYN